MPKASISLALEISDSETYRVSLELPSEMPDKDSPFEFKVEYDKAEKGSSETLTSEVLYVKITDPDNYDARVAPPASLLKDAGAGVMKNLGMRVSAEGGAGKK
jgi:hypothetical protein